MTNDTVIEVCGGCLVAVYSGDREQRFILLDWDDLNELPEAKRVAGLFPKHSLSEMPHDTRRAYEGSPSEDQDRSQ